MCYDKEKGGGFVRKGISQEGLKAIACVTMLIDHIGATLVPLMGLRVIGRLSFPIYCFLLAEGIAHTKNPKKYALRLGIGALLAEIPFDLLFFGKLTLAHQSVMITLLLGFLMAMWARKLGNIMLPFAACFLAAEFLGTDYGGIGVALVGLFVITRELPNKHLIQVIGMIAMMLMLNSVSIPVGSLQVPIQLFAVPAMIPICCYSGRKATANVWLQRAFYLFYPVHLAVLLLIVWL